MRIELRALSPSGKQFEDFLHRLGIFSELSKGQTKVRISDPSPNALSVAMLLTIGDQSVLFGADLEESNALLEGCNAVLEHYQRKIPSHIFKIPHHGSRNAHNEQVWNVMVKKPSWSVVAPWIRGNGKLPNEADIKRLKKFSDYCYITSNRQEKIKKKYSREVIKFAKTSGYDLDTSIFMDGYVTLRWTAGSFKPKVEGVGSATAV